MGAAAYHRGNMAIIQQLSDDCRKNHDPVFELMNEINDLPKHVNNARPWIVARLPFARGRISHSHGVWWLEDASSDPGTSFGYYYPSLRGLVRSWDISLVSYEGNDTYLCENN